jgi:hypothetical protein
MVERPRLMKPIGEMTLAKLEVEPTELKAALAA